MKSNPTTSIIAMRLKTARLAKGLTQEQLGVLAGIDEFSASARMNRYEKGIHEPNYGMMQHIANALGLPVAYFYCDQDLVAELLDTVASLSNEALSQVIEYAKQLQK